jgi:enoyl-CoA hydratase/carnithine racemase
MSSHDGPVSWQLDGRVTIVTVSHPPANALGQPVLDGLRAALDAFDAADSRVLVLASGVTGFFAAGADIKLMNGASPADFARYGQALRDTFDRIAGHRRPSIAAIEGRAMGGGLELAMAASLRVGSVTARLGLPEPKLGLIPGAGGTQRLPRLVGRGRALDMLLTAREVGAQEAHAIGLLDRLVPAGQAGAEALALAAGLCQLSGAALTGILRCADDASALPLAAGLAREAERVNELFAGPEARAGLQAFVQRRRPDYA